MTVEIDLFLFGKPEWEIDMEKMTPDDLRSLGEEIRSRLNYIASLMEKLDRANWNRYHSLYSIVYYKDVGLEDAKEELKRIGIDPEKLDLREIEEE